MPMRSSRRSLPNDAGFTWHPNADPEFKQWVADILAAAIARGEWRYTYSAS